MVAANVVNVIVVIAVVVVVVVVLLLLLLCCCCVVLAVVNAVLFQLLLLLFCFSCCYCVVGVAFDFSHLFKVHFKMLIIAVFNNKKTKKSTQYIHKPFRSGIKPKRA